jgi:plastocyanin
VSAGDNQVDTAGQQLTTALVVIVEDASGTPLSGITVNWAAATGGGSVTPGSGATGADGKASATRTLGPGAGTQTTTASVSGVVTPATFHHVAQIQGATQIQASGPTIRNSDTVLATAAPLVVLVADQNSLPRPGVIVTWTITGGGGSLTQAVDTTDAGGLSSVSWTFNSVSGGKTAQAAVTGLQGSPVSFTASVAAGTATQMALNSGNSQAGPVGAALPAPHTVIVRDAYGNPKSNSPVTWVLGVGGGSLSTTTPTTDASGIAAVTRTLGAAVGVTSDTAKAAGLTGSPVAFTDTAGAVDTVQIHDNFFTPVHDTVAVGTFIRFRWLGAAQHGVSWLNGPGTLPTNSPIQATGEYVARVTQLGTYNYQCTVHGATMPGAVVSQ